MNGNLTTPQNLKNNYAFGNEEIFYPETDGEPMAETDKHRNLIVELIDILKRRFAAQEKVYITGNIMFYYLEGVPEEVVSPDVMVVFGTEKTERRIFKLWEEKTPAVIIEIASHGTFKKDRTEKRELYESLGVTEYFIFNPEYPKTLPSLIAYRLEKGEYQPLKIEGGRVFSESLNLELVDTGNWLRLFDKERSVFVQTADEIINEKNQEIARLEAELARLKND
jgi:Uma2 family endonuclease